jgi:hypothetical protein
MQAVDGGANAIGRAKDEMAQGFSPWLSVGRLNQQRTLFARLIENQAMQLWDVHWDSSGEEMG